MADSFTGTLLAALNESTIVNEREWDAIEATLRNRQMRSGPPPAEVLENRFAATISCCMAKVRSSL